MADVPVKLRRARWDALVSHYAAEGKFEDEPAEVVVPAGSPAKVHGILYLPATYVLDERDTRA